MTEKKPAASIKKGRGAYSAARGLVIFIPSVF
jgi:hypothetical protein